MSVQTPARTWAEIVVHALKINEVRLVTYVPDNVLRPLIEAVEADPYFTVICPAREEEAVLFFDEADSLLFDRTTARASWEVGQVNEMLTWLDRHPYPVIAATNNDDRLDPATKRRFLYKLHLQPLGRKAASRAFERFFGRAAPAGLAAFDRLTPGDFAVVARQLRHEGEVSDLDLLARLADEIAAKGEARGRIGF